MTMDLRMKGWGTTLTSSLQGFAFGLCFGLMFLGAEQAHASLTLFAQPSAPAASGSLVWGDADKDGDLDLWISGSRFQTSTYRSSVLRNDRNGILSPSLGELAQLNRGEASWADFDRDGDLDAVITGYSSSPSVTTTVHRNDLPTAFTTVVMLNRLPPLGDSAIAWADADGDGDLDALICGTTSAGARQAGVYLNTGGGSFSNSLVGLPRVSEGAVAWADFDNDGDHDFVLTGSTNAASSGALSHLYRNLGSAGFAQVPVALPAVYRSFVSWTDFDRDGDPDLLIGGAAPGGPVTQLLRNDSGNFTVATTFPGLADGAAAWGDADQDGYPDLALCGRLSNAGGSVSSQFFWNRSGIFTNSGVNLPGMHFSAMAWGDLDFDGQLDLALSGATNGSLAWSSAFSAVYRNEVPVTNSVPVTPTSLSATVEGSDVLLAWNAPVGLSFDVLIGTTPGGREVMSVPANTVTGVRTLAQAGYAGWSQSLRLRNLPAGTYYWTVQSVNAAYKGSAFATESQFTILNNQPTITTIAAQTMAMNASIGPFPFTIGDAETDPASLVLSVASSSTSLFPEGSVTITGTGANRAATFIPAANESGTATVTFTVRDAAGGCSTASTRIVVNSLLLSANTFQDGQMSVLEPGDADGDGDLDLLLAGSQYISAGSGMSYVRLFVNDGSGALTATSVSLPAVFEGAFAAWGDYDNDNDLDLFYNGGIYRRNVSSYTLMSTLIAGIENGQAAWGDYDMDGDLDLAVTGGVNATQFITRIYRNDGNAVFTDINAPLLGLWFSSIAWADIDGDGDLDLAVAGAAAQNTSISPNGRMYRNNGSDQFVEALNFFGATASKMTWGDVNGDGTLDLALTGSHGGSVVNELQLNLGDWQFARLALHPGASSWVDTKLLDWDSDGDLDLLGGVNSIVALYTNPGTGDFPTTSFASTSMRCRSLRWGDFDNDSDFDVLVSNLGTVSASGTNRLLLNPIINTQPAPPASLTSTVAENSVILRWPTLPTIGGAPVTYNLRVGTAPGLGDIVSPHSRSDGRRLVPAPGNSGYANLRTVRLLPPGTYWWSVQAVDHLWRGQSWQTEQSFTVTAPGGAIIKSIELIDGVQARLVFDAPAGSTVSLRSSVNLSNWTERASVSMGVSGSAERTIAVSDDKTFFKLVIP